MNGDVFKLFKPFEPGGDQPEAIKRLVQSIRAGQNQQALLGVTGSGKTYTMANVIEQIQRPTLIIAHNKTLAAQLYNEFKYFFPSNAVEYFVSYYDYYQPEAYVPSTDTYIEKDAKINEQIDKMRHSATRSVLTRKDTIIVSSVSCIYNLGKPQEYMHGLIMLEEGQTCDRDDLIDRLVDIQYTRNDVDFWRSNFRVRGDVVEVFPVHEEKLAIRVSFFGDDIEKIEEVDALTGQIVRRLHKFVVYPSSHYVASNETVQRAMVSIKEELNDWLVILRKQSKTLEAHRLEQRTNHDLELLNEMGFCPGIENYTRHFTGAKPGERPYTLLDYFPKDWFCIIDESHVTVPQIGAMFKGDRSRKQTLVDFGFRLPSALDNRPMTFLEFERALGQVLYVSATLGPYELKKVSSQVVEQIIRPTGLVDPIVLVRKVSGQVDDLLKEIRMRVQKGQRVLVTTLTKKMAEELTEYYMDQKVKVAYLHSDIKTLDRVQILQNLRQGVVDVLIGINLLREGLDLPEVSLVAILDADKEGFLRSLTSLIQTFGRAARNVDGTVILYGDRITTSMNAAIDETKRRRDMQIKYNQDHNVVVQSVSSLATSSLIDKAATQEWISPKDVRGIKQQIERIRKEMFHAAAMLEFEKAAKLRDQLTGLEQKLLFDDKTEQ